MSIDQLKESVSEISQSTRNIICKNKVTSTVTSVILLVLGVSFGVPPELVVGLIAS